MTFGQQSSALSNLKFVFGKCCGTFLSFVSELYGTGFAKKFPP